MSEGCVTANKSTESVSKEARAFKFKCNSAIQSLIGVPSPAKMRKAAKAYEVYKTRKAKKKWDLETQRYIEHQKLYEEMLSYSMVAGKEANYNTTLANPESFVDSWRNIFARSLRGEINPHTIKQGAYKIRATRKLVNRVIDKREKAMNDNKLSRTAIAIMPPDYVSRMFDKFGFVGGLVNKILTMGDNNVQKSAKFIEPIEEARMKLGETVKQALKSSARKDFRIGQQNIEAIKGFFDVDGNEVLIHDLYTNTLDESVYSVTYPNSDNPDKRKELPLDKLNRNKEDVENALISQYSDKLMAEIGDGQVRRIVPMLIPKKGDANESDLKKIDTLLDTMAKEKEKDQPRKIPGIHTQVKTITNKDGNKENWEYTYVMIKQGELSTEVADRGEQYHTYIINKKEILADGKRGEPIYYVGNQRIGGKNVENKYDMEEISEVLPEGYYRSDTNENFGKHTYKIKSEMLKEGKTIDTSTEEELYTEEEVEGSQKKNWVNFKRMEKQPNKKVMKEFWKSMAKIRDVYDEAFTTLRMQDLAVQKKRNKLNQAIIDWRRVEKGEEPDVAAAWLSKKLEELGAAEHIKVDSRGKLVTSSTYAKRKKENYFPQMYSNFNIFMEQLPRSIGELQQKIDDYLDEFEITREELQEEGEYEGSYLERLDNGLKHLEGIMLEKDLDRDISFLHDLNSMKYLKHITAWTDPTGRRMDGQIHNDYFNKSFNAIHKNEIMVELMDSIYKMTRLEKNLPEGSIEYLVNRVKIAFGDPKSRAQGLLGEKPEGYTDMARKLNSMPSWLTGNAKWDGKSAERFTKWMTAPASMMFLGGSSALGNSAQLVNNVMRVGWKISGQAFSEISSKSKGGKWDEIVNNTGILNTITMFQDIMLQGGSSSMADVGLINFGGIPIPAPNMLQFGKLLKMGRQKFINNKAGDMEDFLLTLLQQEKNPQSLQAIADLRKANKLRQGINNKELREKRGVLYDIFTLEEGASEKRIEELFRNLLSEVSDNKLKQMVSWKLSWWFNELGAPGKDLFTFTASEERLRKYSVVMSLLHAQSVGLLGAETSNWEDQFMTDQAVKIARNGVYYTQFGMTPPYLGEAFNGFGRALWQYKQYPTLQMIHDMEILDAFRDGSSDMFHGFQRITKAISDSTINMVGGNMQKIAPTLMKGRTDFSYDPSDPDADHEAIAMARWIFTRGLASVLASTIGLIPFLGRLTNATNLPIYSLFRGAENPAFGLMTRALLWLPLIMYGLDDDEDEGLINDLTNSVGFMFTPVIIGMMLRGSMSLYETFED